MRLDRLDLTRYGRFTDVRLDFPPPAPDAPDLHVIFGPNEAGKSTLFSAWLDLLYGVPMRSRYDFLHSGPTMQIGAKLTHAGGVLEAVRLKRNGLSLQDGTGQALPEAVMQAALAGLGRDGYAAMFSLDDDTLELGGESILASRGDLGEMLFAASAGLAGLGPQLEGIRRDLDTFHKPRARNSTLKQAKDRLQELDRQRRDLDTTASAAQKLQRDVTAAEKAWGSARHVETAADSALKAIAAALAVLPQQARLARLQAEHAPLTDLPEATEADERDLQGIEHALHGLAGQMATRAEAIAELERRLTALPRDPAILPLAEQIGAVAGLHPLHLAALADLPRRRDRLAEVMGDLTRRLKALGLAAPAADHILAPTVMARLRGLVARRDVAVHTVALAQDEADKAETRLAAARESLGDLTPVQDLQNLGHLVTRLRQTDPELLQTRALHDCAGRAAELAQALLALAPWRGTDTDLTDLAAPAPWQIAAWEAGDLTTARALAEAQDACDRRRADLASIQETILADPTGTPSLTEAAQARARREATWATHLVRLAPDTATAFETALRLDDRITLQLAEAMAAAQRAIKTALQVARITAEVSQAETTSQAAQADRLGWEKSVAGCAAGLGLAGAGLADLRGWLALRDKALAALASHDLARSALDRAKAAVAEAAGHLATALTLSPDRGFALLMAEALARLDTAQQSHAAARRLAEMRADVTDRKSSLTEAAKTLDEWRQDWHAARTGAALLAVPEADAGLATLLDDLDHLTRQEVERSELSDRIAKMEDNSRAFHGAAANVFAALSLPEASTWSGIGDRLTTAEQAERDHANITADLARDLAAQTADQAKADIRTASRSALGDRLGWTGQGVLVDHMAACLRASRLRRDIAELVAELANHPASDQDAKGLENEAAHLQNALTLARSDAEARFADLTEARRALAAIGGDDAIARLAAERANLLNELQDQARNHLAKRFGLIAFEQGLRRYRDSHRSGMLARASDAFRHLTCGEYTGLAAQPEGATEVLVALPGKGGSKLATDLSKGTRFQLYLALRIAGYHELAKSRSPVPFIADDIMETFDDARAAQAFALLGDMSRSGQVIYLTHHEHLCDIAVATCPGARVVDLRAL